MKISHLYWPVTFFSTAFGAGIFFLPQAVGPGVLGMKAFALFIVIAMSVSMMAHYLFFKFITSHPEKDFLAASSTFIGERAAAIVCVLFILSMIIIVLINFITLVNVVASFLHDGFWVRGSVSLLLSAALSAAWLAFSQRIEHLISRMALVSIVLVAILTLFFLLQPAGAQWAPAPPSISLQTLVLLPIFLFTFNFTPCIQRFAKSAVRPQARSILFGKILILAFIAMIVIAISRLLTLDDISIINGRNVDALFYTAGLTGNSMAWLGAALLLCLLTGGAYIGTLTGVIDGITSFGMAGKKGIIAGNIVVCTLIGTINPSIIKIISSWSIPVIVMTVFFIPSLYFLQRGDGWQKMVGIAVLCCGIAVIATLFV
ncbi:threonine/serine transporter [Serratia marcescens]|uniref:threonine/serine transporter n=1 Tax=Serratia sarumanii TaxID=3020826 RepID=UPI001A3291E9|nr:threonine/serine transporter [Serratia marcescens]HEJ6938527.1 threonine/serine transporter [Serratia marcescens]HEJ7846222.1 threonine/serine transporter [Serratia marcescens]